MESLLSQQHLWVATAIVVIAVPAGVIARRLLVRRLRIWAGRTESRVDDALVASLQRPILLWSVLAGLYVAVRVARLSEHAALLADKLVLALLVVSLTFWAADLCGRLLGLASAGRDGQALPVTGVVQNVARIAILVIGGIVLLGTLGISVTPVVTTLGIGGLAVALGLQETLSNVFAGIHITVAKNIRVGDFVRLESGEEGTIEDIGWRTTRVRMLPNNVVLVPNNRLAQSIVTNYELPSKDLAVLVDVGVHYASDLAHVERVTCEVAREVLQTVPGGVPDFDAFMRYKSFGESSIDFTVIMRGRDFVSGYLIKHEFMKRLHERYGREGIVIPFPIRAINLEQEASESLGVALGAAAARRPLRVDAAASGEVRR